MTAPSPPTEAPSPVTSNPWSELRQFTSARIALGRAGTSLPTQPHLAFQLAHARARVAVHREADFTALRSALEALGPEVHLLHSAAATRPIYLQRPDLGRRLDDASAAALGGGSNGGSSDGSGGRSTSGPLSGTPSTFTGDELIPAMSRTYDYRLHDPV